VKNVEQAPTDELVARYAAAARRHGEATAGGGPPANPEAEEIATIYQEPRRRQKEPVVLAPLDSEDAGMRAWAGAQALEFAPNQGGRFYPNSLRKTVWSHSARRSPCVSGARPACSFRSGRRVGGLGQCSGMSPERALDLGGGVIQPVGPRLVRDPVTQ
jgi:hypothetical protein